MHFGRFQRRSSIQPAIPILEWPEFNTDPDDIILMVKLYASSRNTCDMHKVFLPACELAKLPDQPTLMTQRNEFVQRQIDDFNTTLKFIRKEPWNMHAAGDYIEQLIHNNSQGTSSTWTLPQLGCVLQGRHLEDIEEAPDYTVDDSALTQTTAQPVVAHPEALRRRITTTKTAKGKASASPAIGDPRPQDSTRVVGQVMKKPSVRAQAKSAQDLPAAQPPEPDAQLGCSKCRRGRRGCTYCRRKRGMFIADGKWVWPEVLSPPASTAG